jgi:hypothetical protein
MKGSEEEEIVFNVASTQVILRQEPKEANEHKNEDR